MIDVPPDLVLWLILGWLFVIGAVIGSFLNVCVYRIPQHEKLGDQLRGLISPGSHCPKCQSPIRSTDNVPIIGWLRLRGRCRNCQCRISFRYPLIELLNGLLFVMVYWLELPHEFQTVPEESSTWSPLVSHFRIDQPDIWTLHLRYVYHMVLIEALFVASLIDLDTMTIPDGSTVPAMIVGCVGALAVGQLYLVPVWFQDRALAEYAPGSLKEPFGPMTSLDEEKKAGPHQEQAVIRFREYRPGTSQYGRWLKFPRWVLTHPHLHGLAVSLAGLIVGGGLVWGVRLVGFWTLKREAMGFGDVILVALIGSFLGWQPTLVAFFVAPFLAMGVTILRWIVRLFTRPKSQEGYIPYGPYLSLAALVVVLSWKWMWPVVAHLFSAGLFVPLMGIVLLILMIPALLFIQLVKKLLGIPLYPEEEDFAVWTSADTLTYLASEVVERDRQHWATQNEWPGVAAGQGTIFEERWRNRDNATGWPE